MKKLFLILSLLSLPMVSKCMEDQDQVKEALKMASDLEKEAKKKEFCKKNGYPDKVLGTGEVKTTSRLQKFKNFCTDAKEIIKTSCSNALEGFKNNSYYSKTITKYSAYAATILAAVGAGYFGYKKYGHSGLKFLHLTK
jgi:hypothetical protein